MPPNFIKIGKVPGEIFFCLSGTFLGEILRFSGEKVPRKPGLHFPGTQNSEFEYLRGMIWLREVLLQENSMKR